MKKFLRFFIMLVLVTGSTALFAGSIDYQSARSADYMRTYNRNGALEGTDIVHFNPAATAFLAPGFHIQFSNQTFYLDYEIEADGFPAPGVDGSYPANGMVWSIPNLYAAYNGGNWAGFASVGITAGGGGLTYEDGVPFFTAGVVATGGTVDDISVEGSAFYIGATLGGSYAINNMISVSLAGKFVYANVAGVIDLSVTGGTYDGEGKLEYTNTATGFGGIIGVDIKVNEQLNIGLRFESEIALEFETDITKDSGTLTGGGGLMTDGDKQDKDLPAVIGLGVQYKINEQFTVITTFQGYMIGWANESDDDGYTDEYDDFGWEAGLAVEYEVMPRFLKLSLGYLYSVMGGNEDTYSDMDYQLDSHSFGLGGRLTAMENLDITLGLTGVFYVEGESDTIGFDETFNKTVYGFSLGVDYKI